MSDIILYPSTSSDAIKCAQENFNSIQSALNDNKIDIIYLKSHSLKDEKVKREWQLNAKGMNMSAFLLNQNKSIIGDKDMTILNGASFYPVGASSPYESKLYQNQIKIAKNNAPILRFENIEFQNYSNWAIWLYACQKCDIVSCKFGIGKWIKSIFSVSSIEEQSGKSCFPVALGPFGLKSHYYDYKKSLNVLYSVPNKISDSKLSDSVSVSNVSYVNNVDIVNCLFYDNDTKQYERLDLYYTNMDSNIDDGTVCISDYKYILLSLK